MESDKQYFDSYAHFGIHEEMLADRQRTEAYRNAISRSRNLFMGKTVLDVGCGTGILSLFAAEAGARLVIGIEKSAIAEKAEEIVAANGLGGKITIIRAKIEEAVLPVKTVDIIISEWMGYFLVYESMLSSVLYARDKYLVKDGLLFPDTATLRICALEDGEYKHSKISFWEDVYGFDMSCLQKDVLREPLVDTVDPKNIVSETKEILHLNLYTALANSAFTAPFVLTLNKTEQVHAFVCFFECTFSHSTPPIVLSTSPFRKPTHWKQAIFYLHNDILGTMGDTITGTIRCASHKKNNRHLSIEIDYTYNEGENQPLEFEFI